MHDGLKCRCTVLYTNEGYWKKGSEKDKEVIKNDKKVRYRCNLNPRQSIGTTELMDCFQNSYAISQSEYWF